METQKHIVALVTVIDEVETRISINIKTPWDGDIESLPFCIGSNQYVIDENN